MIKIDNDSVSSAKLPQIYLKMTDWYWRGKNKDKAIQAAQKIIAVMESEKDN